MKKRLCAILIVVVVALALAVGASPPHACCVRKAAHQCHGSEADQRAVCNTGCCNRDCCRAVTTSQSAQLRPTSVAVGAGDVDARIADSQGRIPITERLASQSTRAPPPVSIA